MQNLVSGKEYQHAHADQGRPQSFRDQTIYPFVAQHEFGKYPFQLWLLPNATNDIEYGYLKTFNARALVLLRGDFVHAGGVSTDPRCHMSALFTLDPQQDWFMVTRTIIGWKKMRTTKKGGNLSLRFCGKDRISLLHILSTLTPGIKTNACELCYPIHQK